MVLRKMRWKDCSARSGLSGSSGKSGCSWQEGDAGLAAWLMPAPATPDKRMPMRVPVGGRALHRSDDLLPALEPPALERQGAQHLPPGLDQVEVGRVLGLEHHLPAWVGEHEQEHVRGAMAAQVVHDR